MMSKLCEWPGVKEDDFRSSLHFCVLPACCGVALWAGGCGFEQSCQWTDLQWQALLPCIQRSCAEVLRSFHGARSLHPQIVCLFLQEAPSSVALCCFEHSQSQQRDRRAGWLIDVLWCMFDHFLPSWLSSTDQSSAKPGPGTMQHKVTKQSGQK